MKNILLVFIIFIFTVLVTRAPLAADKVFIGFGFYQSPPFVFIKDGFLVGGIMQDMASEIGHRLGLPITMVAIPRKRLPRLLKNGTIDIRCHLSPVWIRDADNFLWSEPLYKLETRVATHIQNIDNITTLKDLHGLSIGTVRGYFYAKSLTDIIKSGNASQEVTNSVTNLLKMLDRGRIDVAVGNKRHLEYLLSTENLEQEQLGPDLAIAPLIIRSQDIHCAISKHDMALANALLTTIEEMRVDGIFDQLLNQY